jgi:RNA polymerase sigma factor (sigma-70 family)
MSLFLDHPELLPAFREGRREALDRVYRTYRRSVERNLRALAHVHGAVELAQASAIADLSQEVFVRAFSETARRGYDGLRAFGPYLASVLRNCFIDALRARGREVLREPAELRVELEGMVQASDDVGLDPQMGLLLSKYIAGLPPALAGVYQQRFVLGRSQEQASVALGLSRRVLRTGEKRLCGGLRRALVEAGISIHELSTSNAQAAARNGKNAGAAAQRRTS